MRRGDCSCEGLRIPCERDKALDWLERAYETRHVDLNLIEVIHGYTL